MSNPAKPYHLGKVITLGIGTAVAFALISLFFLSMQARNAHDRIAGEVIQVASDTITIRNARGVETLLTPTMDVELRGVAAISDLLEGQHIMLRGTFLDKGRFEFDRLRILKNNDNK